MAQVTLDSNLLVYAADVQAGERHLASVDLFRRAIAHKQDCVLVLQTLAEFFHVATRRVGLPVEAAMHGVTRWRHAFRVVAADIDTLDEAVRATHEHRLSFWDAMVWATAKRAGCRYLLSEDFQDGRALGGVTFVDPFKAENRRVVDAVLPPS